MKNRILFILQSYLYFSFLKWYDYIGLTGAFNNEYFSNKVPFFIA